MAFCLAEWSKAVNLVGTSNGERSGDDGKTLRLPQTDFRDKASFLADPQHDALQPGSATEFKAPC